MLFWHIMAGALFVLVSGAFAVVGIVFLRAFSVRLMVGKWPHQDEEAKKLFDSLP